MLVLALTVLAGCAPGGRLVALDRDLDRCTLLHDPGQGEEWSAARRSLFSDGYFLGEPGGYIRDCLRRRGWSHARIL
ncbi:hypothetical protein IAI18_02320 [Acetobacteraceae bacterium H6797]|nr:hypothetical protein [Acetobacteraceae bacterium H6797]